jgi:hypothetical protein
MTRPAVIIGLGGTGQWILTYLKKDLLELNNGVMPKNVRLLAFDTVTQAEAQKADAGGSYAGEQASYEKQAKRIGNIELDLDTELIHIGGDCYPLAEEIERGEHPHLNWFDVKYWKYEAGLGRDNWILDRGAGRFRQFGLLAVYKDLLGGPVRSKILKFLPAAIRDVRANVEDEASFELIVVSSVAGGTGSAMLIPFGVLAKQMFGNALVRTRAIVVLPSAFTPGQPSAELELRGGAALRELARAMMPPQGYSSHTNFLPNSEYEKVAYSRPFDGVYFIDGTKGGTPINKDPKYGVFPAVSGWIRQILDEQSGTWFTNFVATNRAAVDRTRQAEGVFGVFGVKSLYAPERSLRQTYRLKLANQVIRQIADPKPSGAGGTLVANAFPSGAPEPSEQAYSLLRQTANYKDEHQLTTTFMAELARIIQSGGSANADEVANKAQAGWYGKRDSERTVHSWLAPLTDLPANSVYDDFRNDVQIEKAAILVSAAPLSKDPSSQIAHLSITTNIPNFIRSHHGGLGANGPDDYGSFGVMTEKCVEVQVRIFQEVLRLSIMSMLSENQGRGRIGYVVNVLKALEKVFSQFDDFMKAVEKKRGQLSPQAELQKRVASTLGNWERMRKSKPNLWEKLQSKPSEKAVRAERECRDSYLYLVNYVREVTLHNSSKAAARTMQQFTQNTRRELERWVATLLEGDKAQDMNGLLSESDANVRRITTAIKEDQRSNEVEELVQVTTREAQIQAADEAWALAGVMWNAEDRGDGLRLKLLVEPEAVKKGELTIVREGLTQTERRKIEHQNLSTLEGVLEQRFGQNNQVQDIIVWCEQNFAPKDMAKTLESATEPMTSLTTSAKPSMQACSISLKKENDPNNFAGQLEEEMRLILTGSNSLDNNNPVNVIGSEDPFRLTAVRTQVGLKLEEFTTWKKCQDAYQRELNQVQIRQDQNAVGEGLAIESNKKLARLLQSQYTQKEEKEAIQLEVKWRENGLGHRILNPRMVSLVGESRKLKLALQCWVLGWVNEVEDNNLSGRYHWEVKVPGWDYEFWLTTNGDKGERDKFQALEAFVLVGLNKARGRENVPMNWDSLNQVLVDQRKPSPGGESVLRAAVLKALEKEGIIAQWEAAASGHIDHATEAQVYDNPAYHDLADYATRYFRSSEW